MIVWLMIKIIKSVKDLIFISKKYHFLIIFSSKSDKVIIKLIFLGGVTCQKEKKDSKCISQGKIGL